MFSLESLAIVSRSILAVVFVSAGLLKMAGASPVGATMAAFGFRGAFWNAAGRWLPALEIAVAVALVWPQTAFIGAITSVLLLGAFTAVMLAALKRGEAPPCNCFGAVTPEPISRRTVARNLALLAVAVTATLTTLNAPVPSLLAWATGSSFLVEALVLVTILLFLAVLALGRTLHQALDAQRTLQASLAVLEHVVDRAEPPRIVRDTPPVENGLPIGAPAPTFSLSDLKGDKVTLDHLLAQGNPVLFVSASASCGPCRTLMPQLAEWAREHRTKLTVLIAYAGGQPDPSLLTGPLRVVTADDTVNTAYRLQWTPAAVLIDAAGHVASPVTSGSEAIAALVSLVASRDRADVKSLGPHFLSSAPGIPIGAPAPALPAIEQARPRLVVFWRIGCPHCRSMVAAMQRWAAERHSRPAHAPDVLLVNWSNESSVGLDGFEVLHDEAGELARSFGATGTPSAILVGADGTVASAIGIGAPNVLALLGA